MKLSDMEQVTKLVLQLEYARERQRLLDQPVEIAVVCLDQQRRSYSATFRPDIEEEGMHKGQISEGNFYEIVALALDATKDAITRLEDDLRELGVEP